LNIIKVLSEDHADIQDLLKRCSYGRRPGTRVKYFVELKRCFEMHSFLEQLILYPALMDAGFDTVHVRARQEEIVELLAELDSLTPEDESWRTKFRVIKKQIEVYITEEEKDLLEASKKNLDSKVLQDLGAAMVAKTAEQRAVQ